VLIPQENEKDLADIPENVKQGLEIIPIATVDEALALALTSPLEPIEWVDPARMRLCPRRARRRPTRSTRSPTPTSPTKPGCSRLERRGETISAPLCC
jgi:ATP-dependent Lon protease